MPFFLFRLSASERPIMDRRQIPLKHFEVANGDTRRLRKFCFDLNL